MNGDNETETEESKVLGSKSSKLVALQQNGVQSPTGNKTAYEPKS